MVRKALVRQHPIASPGEKLSSEARLKRNAGSNFGQGKPKDLWVFSSSNQLFSKSLNGTGFWVSARIPLPTPSGPPSPRGRGWTFSTSWDWHWRPSLVHGSLVLRTRRLPRRFAARNDRRGRMRAAATRRQKIPRFLRTGGFGIHLISLMDYSRVEKCLMVRTI